MGVIIMDTFRNLVDRRLSNIKADASLCEDIIDGEKKYIKRMNIRHSFTRAAAVAACVVMCVGGVAGARYVLRPELANEMAPDADSRNIIEESGRVGNVEHKGLSDNDMTAASATDNGITISLLQYVGGPNRLKCVFEVKGDAIRDIPVDSDVRCGVANGGISKVNDKLFAYEYTSGAWIQDFGMRTSEDSFTFITENSCDVPAFENGNTVTFTFKDIVKYVESSDEDANEVYDDRDGIVTTGNWEISIPLKYEYDAIHYDVNETVELFGKEVKVTSVDVDETGYRVYFSPDSIEKDNVKTSSIGVVYDYQGDDKAIEKADDQASIAIAKNNGWLKEKFGDYDIYFGEPSETSMFVESASGKQREPIETVLLLDKNGSMIGGLGQEGGDITDGYVREGVWYYYGKPDESGNAKITEIIDPSEITTLKFMNGYEIKLK